MQHATAVGRTDLKEQKKVCRKDCALLWTNGVALFFALSFSVLPPAMAEEGGKKEPPLTAVEQLGVWLVGIHPIKDNPAHQFVAHHFCHQLTS
jgi:hypothetical protein